MHDAPCTNAVTIGLLHVSICDMHTAFRLVCVDLPSIVVKQGHRAQAGSHERDGMHNQHCLALIQLP